MGPAPPLSGATTVCRTDDNQERAYLMDRGHDPGGASPEPGNRSKGAPHGAPFSLVGKGPLPMPPPDPHHEQEGTRPRPNQLRPRSRGARWPRCAGSWSSTRRWKIWGPCSARRPSGKSPSGSHTAALSDRPGPSPQRCGHDGDRRIRRRRGSASGTGPASQRSAGPSPTGPPGRP